MPGQGVLNDSYHLGLPGLDLSLQSVVWLAAALAVRSINKRLGYFLIAFSSNPHDCPPTTTVHEMDHARLWSYGGNVVRATSRTIHNDANSRTVTEKFHKVPCPL